MDPEYFTEPMKDANPQLRLLHYMGVQRKTLEAAGHWRINPHCDYGLCTILFQDQVGGLEVDPDHTGKFLPATPVRGTCVINVRPHYRCCLSTLITQGCRPFATII
jgi:isopenicillin N synthase-like dioxygenase